MINNNDIDRMLRLFSSTLMNEVETNNANTWENTDSIRLYECLQNAIQQTHALLCPDCVEPLPRPIIDPNKLLRK